MQVCPQNLAFLSVLATEASNWACQQTGPPLFQGSEPFDDSICHDVQSEVGKICHCICDAVDVESIG